MSPVDERRRTKDEGPHNAVRPSSFVLRPRSGHPAPGRGNRALVRGGPRSYSSPRSAAAASKDRPTMIAGEIEDLYPLSPVQQGMLFHTLYAPAAGVYLQQVSGVLHGELDLAAFRQAWAQAQARHTVLRSAVLWEDLAAPLLVVLRH